MNRPNQKAYIHVSDYLEALEKYVDWLEDVSGVCLPSDVDDSDVVCCDEGEFMMDLEGGEGFATKEDVIRYFMNKIGEQMNTILEVLDG